MRKAVVFFAIFAAIAAAQAGAASPVQTVLDANRAAMGGANWSGKETLTLDYAYAGQGFTGTTHAVEDLVHGAFVDSSVIGPDRNANGYDGARTWLEDPSGTITWQGGGDTGTLAVNESYRDRNLWWRADLGGAAIMDDRQKSEGGRRFDVLTVTPKGGTSFDAWFDAKTHLLDRIAEVQGTLPMTMFYSDYSPVDGVLIAHKEIIDDSTGAAGRQTLTLTGAAFSAARPASAYSKPTAALHDFHIEGGATQTSVPFKLINNHVYADISVNGSKPMQVVFDTGGDNALEPATAEALGVHVAGAQTDTGGGSGTITGGRAHVNSIRIGDAVLVNQTMTVERFGNPGEGIEEKGMIGYETFARFVTRIDYGKHIVTFIDPDAFDPKDAGTPVPFRFYDQFPEMPGSYDGIPGRFGLDTGARTPLVLTRQFVDANDLRARATTGAVALTGWGVGGPTRTFVTRGGMLQLGDVRIAHPLTEFSVDKGGAFAAAAFPNNVGGGVLKRFVVTLDYAHYRIFFKPIAGPIADLDTFDRSGMWINAAQGGFQIVDVTAGGPADKAGLRKGDTIAAVNGKPVSVLALADLRRMLRDEPPGTVVTFAIQSANGAKNVPVTLRDQI